VRLLAFPPVLAAPILAVTDEETTVGPSNVGVGAVVLTVIVVAFLGWVGWLVLSSRRRAAAQEETPRNLQPFLSDDELENKRVTRVLNAAVVVAAVLALSMPIYFINEAGRQDRAEEKRSEEYIEDGEHWFTEFSCVNCHGPGGTGGAAPFVEARSGMNVSWAVPSLNDIFYRYSDAEVRHWITYGRQGTPMPANGLEGGGAMTLQEIDQVIAYLGSIQIPQDEAAGEVNQIVDQEINRLAGADATVEGLILEQEAEIEDIVTGPDRFAAIEDFPGEIRGLMAGDWTCTNASAAAVGSSCGEAGTDADRDGLVDEVETRLSEIGAVVDETVLIREVEAPAEEGAEPEIVAVPDPDLPELYGLTLDPGNPYTTTSESGDPIPDLERATVFLAELDTAHLTLGVLTERNDVFLENAQSGLDFLEEAAATRPWEIDVDRVAGATGLTEEDATRAAALFNGYCARCHTSGFSAGVAYTQEAGSGAWGPSLQDGRAITQFPDVADHIEFVTDGTDDNIAYGINGLGTGRMPGFGMILSVDDIELIVAFERSL
jgi:mono/diheme cytochrome c family protein